MCTSSSGKVSLTSRPSGNVCGNERRQLREYGETGAFLCRPEQCVSGKPRDVFVIQTAGSAGRVAKATRENTIKLNTRRPMPIKSSIGHSLELINAPWREQLATETLLRCSRLTKPVDCCLCERKILPGEMYRNGGTSKRAHETCVQARGISNPHLGRCDLL